MLTRASRRAASSRAFESPPVRVARTASATDGTERGQPGGQVLGEPDQQAGGGLGIRQRAMRLRELEAEEVREGRQLVDLEVRVGLAREGQRVEVAALLEWRPVAERGLQEAEVEADVVADDDRVTGEVEEPPWRLRRASGALATSASVMPCSWLPTMGRPGLTRVDQRSVILPPLTSHRADLDEVGHLGVAAGRLDVEDDELAAGLGGLDEVQDGAGAGLEEGRDAWPCRPAFCSCSWRSMSGWSARWPNRMASAMTSSGSSLAPASTIMIASRVPETTRSSSDSASWLKVGLTTNSPSMRPMRTAPTGPWKGISLMRQRGRRGDRCRGRRGRSPGRSRGP